MAHKEYYSFAEERSSLFCFLHIFLEARLMLSRNEEDLYRDAKLITIQDPVEPTSFWVNPFGVAWPLLKASDLILVNKDGKVVDGGPCRLLNTAGRLVTSLNIYYIAKRSLTAINSLYDSSCGAHSSS